MLRKFETYFKEQEPAEEEPVEEPAAEEEPAVAPEAKPTEKEIAAEEPELADLTKLPFSEKISVVIKFIKEFGYSDIDFKIENGKNVIILKGDIEQKDISEIKKFMVELGLNLKINKEKVDKETDIIRMEFTNKLTAKTFKDVFRELLKGKEEEEFGEE